MGVIVGVIVGVTVASTAMSLNEGDSCDHTDSIRCFEGRTVSAQAKERDIV